ncbi:MAG TPA: hypothetical protein VFJ94_04035, partial [Intrasporangium sp.]|nr:hypothetical protein [Intrasporangium sp.]
MQLLRPGLVALAGLAALGGCGSGDAPLTPVTVTVAAPDAGTPAAATPSSVPTVGATPTGSGPRTLPYQLSAGSPVGAPRTFAEAQGRLARAVVDPAVRGTFRSPTGNLFCDVSAGAAVPACEVAQGRVAPPAPMVCP